MCLAINAHDSAHSCPSCTSIQHPESLGHICAFCSPSRMYYHPLKETVFTTNDARPLSFSENKRIPQATVLEIVFQHWRKMQLFWKLIACKCCLFLLLRNHSFWMQLFTQVGSTVLHRRWYCFVVSVILLSICVLHILWTSQHVSSVSFICTYDQPAYLFKLFALIISYVLKKKKKKRRSPILRVLARVRLSAKPCPPIGFLCVILRKAVATSELQTFICELAITLHFSSVRWSAF